MISYRADNDINIDAICNLLYLEIKDNRCFSDEFKKRIEAMLTKSTFVASAWDDSKLIGICSGISDNINIFMSILIVDPSYRRKHIGTYLVRLFKIGFSNQFIHYIKSKQFEKFFMCDEFKEDYLAENDYSI